MFQGNHYAINSAGGRVERIALMDIPKYNASKWDTYWTPNNFKGHNRKKEDLTEITCFYADLDKGDKGTQAQAIKSLKIDPSSIIETKNGFHVYWYLKEVIDARSNPVGIADWYCEFQKTRIVPALNADPQATDACRLMRSAFQRYWKDGKGTFTTDIVYETDNFYTLKEIKHAFPDVGKPKPAFTPSTLKTTSFKRDDSFWSKANSINGITALTHLSGTPHCNGERFKFKQEGGGRTRVLINDKPSNVWVDEHGKIGSTDGAGPGLAKWIYWYQKDWARVAQILKQEFPELEGDKK